MSTLQLAEWSYAQKAVLLSHKWDSAAAVSTHLSMENFI